MLGLIGWIGRIILIALIIRLIVSMFSSGARRPADNAPRGGRGAGGGRGHQGRPEKAVAKLVRDPQCGTYVSESGSIAARHGGEVLHFCSEKCRDEYLAAPRAAAV